MFIASWWVVNTLIVITVPFLSYRYIWHSYCYPTLGGVEPYILLIICVLPLEGLSLVHIVIIIYCYCFIAGLHSRVYLCWVGHPVILCSGDYKRTGHARFSNFWTQTLILNINLVWKSIGSNHVLSFNLFQNLPFCHIQTRNNDLIKPFS